MQMTSAGQRKTEYPVMEYNKIHTVHNVAQLSVFNKKLLGKWKSWKL